VGHEQDQHLAHHFKTPQQQFESAKLGMWTFLATEILLFSGLFCAYAVYRANHPEIFIYAHRYLSITLGGTNTVVLICSSLTMAWAVRCAQMGKRMLLILLLVVTLVCACGFLSIKYVEYQQKWKHGLLWGRRYHPQAHEHEGEGARASTSKPAPTTTRSAGTGDELRSEIRPAPAGPPGLAQPAAEKAHEHVGEEPHNVQMFFAVYFAMTGLHALHVLAGMGAITWILARSIKGHFSSRYFLPVDLVGLYWHLVDIVWIFLFPLLYLIH
jgi:cytochrome c oxidase subunit 3